MIVSSIIGGLGNQISSIPAVAYSHQSSRDMSVVLSIHGLF